MLELWIRDTHRDSVGVINMVTLHGGYAHRAGGTALLLRWNRCRWEPKKAIKTLEARIPTKWEGQVRVTVVEKFIFGIFYGINGDKCGSAH